MRGIGVISLLACVAQAFAKDSMDKFVEKLVDGFVGNLFGRSLEAWHLHSADLDGTTLGMPGYAAFRSSQSKTSPLSASQGASFHAPHVSSPFQPGPQFQPVAGLSEPYFAKYMTTAQQQAAGAAGAPDLWGKGFGRSKVSSRAAESEVDAVGSSESGYSCPRTLLVLVDPEPDLKPGSIAAMKTAAKLSTSLGSELTVAFIDAESWNVDLPARGKSIDHYMQECNREPGKYEVVELKMKQGETGTTVISDMAEERFANMVIFSTDVVHKKIVDVNVLSEFVDCPFMVVPDV